jgi:hypothetical protein
MEAASDQLDNALLTRGPETEPSTNKDQDDSPMEGDETESSSRKKFRWGTMGVIFGAGITVFIVFVIGAIFAPSISLDASSVAGLAVESGKTYEEAVSEYGVFFVVSGVLVKARFVLAVCYWLSRVSSRLVCSFSFKPINSFDANSGSDH